MGDIFMPTLSMLTRLTLYCLLSLTTNARVIDFL